MAGFFTVSELGLDFGLVLTYLVLCAGVLVVGLIVRCGLSNWYKRVETERLRKEKKRMAELEEQAKHSLEVPVEPISLGKTIKNIDPFYVFVATSIIFLGAAAHSLFVLLNGIDIYGVGIAEEDIGKLRTLKRIRHMFLVMEIGLFGHGSLMPVVMLCKVMDWRPSKVCSSCQNKPRKQFDEEGMDFAVFSVELKCLAKLYFFTVGLVLGLFEKILNLIQKITPLDLHIFWIPSPFVTFAKNREIIESMRVQKRTVKYDLDFGDAYLRFCYEKLLNFLTLTLWERCFAGKMYLKWLDSRIRFVGIPPPSGSNSFKYHAAGPHCNDHCTACCWGCVPCLGAYFGDYVLEKATVEDMILGGAKVTFDESFDKCAWLGLYVKTCCRLCQGMFNKGVDSHIRLSRYLSKNQVEMEVALTEQGNSSRLEGKSMPENQQPLLPGAGMHPPQQNAPIDTQTMPYPGYMGAHGGHPKYPQQGLQVPPMQNGGMMGGAPQHEMSPMNQSHPPQQFPNQNFAGFQSPQGWMPPGPGYPQQFQTSSGPRQAVPNQQQPPGAGFQGAQVNPPQTVNSRMANANQTHLVQGQHSATFQGSVGTVGTPWYPQQTFQGVQGVQGGWQPPQGQAIATNPPNSQQGPFAQQTPQFSTQQPVQGQSNDMIRSPDGTMAPPGYPQQPMQGQNDAIVIRSPEGMMPPSGYGQQPMQRQNNSDARSSEGMIAFSGYPQQVPPNWQPYPGQGVWQAPQDQAMATNPPNSQQGPFAQQITQPSTQQPVQGQSNDMIRSPEGMMAPPGYPQQPMQGQSNDMIRSPEGMMGPSGYPEQPMQGQNNSDAGSSEGMIASSGYPQQVPPNWQPYPGQVMQNQYMGQANAQQDFSGVSMAQHNISMQGGAQQRQQPSQEEHASTDVGNTTGTNALTGDPKET
eukprot:gb/GECG01016703.1/.p1 GENE.gb/GECG01016703.1/~~gb/GECG01016703.1/.p1  ORF type:complete len:913 (+),score=93.75 gb/GECG01016703.1/:1-2739(+)